MLSAAPVVRVDDPDDLPAALRTLGVRCGRPVLVSVGGASGMAEPEIAAVTALVRQHLVPLAGRLDVAVVDGGTRAGIMEIMGSARADVGADFPLIGVAAVGTVTAPHGDGTGADPADADPGHSHFVMVPGQEWGAESPWLAAVGTAVASGSPSVTVVINGGEITYDDVDSSLEAARPVIVLSGTGRVADAIAAAVAGNGGDDRVARIAASPLVQVVPLADPVGVAKAVETALGGARMPSGR